MWIIAFSTQQSNEVSVCNSHSNRTESMKYKYMLILNELSTGR